MVISFAPQPRGTPTYGELEKTVRNYPDKAADLARMTAPVTNSKTDRDWQRYGEDAGVLKGGEKLHGKTVKQTEQAQRPTPKGTVKSVVQDHAAEAAHQLASAAGGKLAGLAAAAAGPGYGLYTMLNATYTAVQEGQQLNEAHRRDAVNLAVVYAGAGSLPSEYVQSQTREKRAVAGERGGAMKILTPLMRDNAKWNSVRADVQKFAKLGQAQAGKLGLDSEAALNRRLATDRNFRTAYEANLAFKHGVDAAVFMAGRKRD